MPVYQIGSKEYELPDGLSEEDRGYALQQLYLRDKPQEQPQENPQEQQKPSISTPSSVPYPAPADSIDPDLLSGDSHWLRASQAIYRLNEGQDWQGEDSELAEYGLDYMGWFNYNLPKMGYEAAQLKKAPQEHKEAFLYLMDAYDNLEMSWGGTGRFFKRVLADPTTYAGLASLCIGTAAATGAKQATKVGLREVLKQSLKVGVVAGVEGAVYAVTDNLIRQGVEVDAGRKEEIDKTELAVTTTVGGFAGLTLGTAMDAAAGQISKAFKKCSGQVKPDNKI